jgi:hypothetical protein
VLPADVAHFRAQGANAVLPKPLVLEDFEELLIQHARQNSQPSLNVSADQTMDMTVSFRQSSKQSTPSLGTECKYSSVGKIHPEDMA